MNVSNKASTNTFKIGNPGVKDREYIYYYLAYAVQLRICITSQQEYQQRVWKFYYNLKISWAMGHTNLHELHGSQNSYRQCQQKN